MCDDDFVLLCHHTVSQYKAKDVTLTMKNTGQHLRPFVDGASFFTYYLLAFPKFLL